MSWGSPIKPKKEKIEFKPEKIEKIKPQKLKISCGAAKRIVQTKHNLDKFAILWIERYIEDLARSNSYPLQLISNDFIGQLCNLLNATDATNVLLKMRSDFSRAFPLLYEKPKDDFDFLNDATKNDPSIKYDE